VLRFWGSITKLQRSLAKIEKALKWNTAAGEGIGTYTSIGTYEREGTFGPKGTFCPIGTFFFAGAYSLKGTFCPVAMHISLNQQG
jgi:hypothetical protein